VTVSSVRDLLVGRETDDEHDERAGALANRLLDGVLVHADPRFARLEETFRPRTPLRVPVWHTGFVVRPCRRRPATPGKARVVVSAGGGRFGAPLLHAAIGAHRLLDGRVDMKLVAGPFLPESDWRRLLRHARSADGVVLRRSVPDLGAELAAASASVSQCGYNTALEVVSCGIPALVVPFVAPGEDEQIQRAGRLARRGAVRVLSPRSLSPAALAHELEQLLDFRPAPHSLDVDGGARSAELIDALVRERLRGAA
jgi:predicted glycosyltransferase